MTGFGVYTSYETLQHKIEDGRLDEGRFAFWEFPRSLPKVRSGERFWVATMGRWQGYFIITELKGPDSPEVSYAAKLTDEFANAPDGSVCFYSDTWVPVFGDDMGLERSPFQGFTYKVPVTP